MGLFEEFGIGVVHHYAPLHYLPFIARSRALYSKPTLRSLGYAATHLRSMSSRHDVARGFGDCAFLTIDPNPRILNGKLKRGFPHFAIRIPVSAIETTSFSLSRYNVAMTRVLRRDGLQGRPESPSNGRYYENRQLPIASDQADKRSLLRKHLPLGTMIEVLIHGDLALPNETEICCYCADDLRIAKTVLRNLSVPWAVRSEMPQDEYRRRADYVDAVEAFIHQALSNPHWRGNGLEFDRLA